MLYQRREEKTSKTQEVVVLGREGMEEGREGGKKGEPFIDVLKGMMIHCQENQEARMN